MYRRIRNFTLVSSLSLTLLLTASQASAQVNLFTSFEPADIPLNSTDFTLGTPPDSAHFTGGITLTVGNPFAYRNGIASWAILTPNGGTGTIDFDNPASVVSMWAINLGGGTGRVDVFDNADVQVGSIPIVGTNMMNANAFISFTPGDFGALEIGKVEVVNVSGAANIVWIDDFSATVSTTIAPDSFSMVRGVLIGGSLSDLFASDDLRLDVRAGLTLFLGESPLQVAITGTSPVETPSELRFKLEASVNTPGLTQTIELFNYDTSLYEQVDLAVPGFSDGIVNVVVTTNPGRFVQAGTREMRAKVLYGQVGLTLLWPWSAKLDQAVWSITP